MSATLMPTVGALLVGGASRRMGEPKSGLEFGGRPLGQWPAAALADICEHRVQVGSAPVPGLGWPCVPDRRTGAGPGAGIESALLYAPGAAVVLCAVDTPFVSAGLLAAALARVAEGSVAAAPRHGGRWHPLCGACSPSLLPRLGAWLDAGRRDLQRLYDEVGATPLEGDTLAAFGDPERLLLNVNEPADLARARELL